MMGDKTIRFIQQHENEDVHTLALQVGRYPDINMPFVINQIKGRQIAREKIPSWHKVESLVYPPHLSLEQSSSEKTALYKASLCSGERLVDLTGGLGADFSFMSVNFQSAFYVEKQAVLTEIAGHNFKELELKNVHVIHCDAVKYLHEMAPADVIYIDPARRDIHGRKIVRIEDCTPDLTEIEPLLEQKGKRTLIKLSPMLDISLALKTLKSIAEIHIISVDNECKELLFIKNKNNKAAPVFHCVNIQQGKTTIFSSTKEKEEKAEICYANEIGDYLYEPNASILKGGLYKSCASEYGLGKLHPNSHLYTSGRLEKDFQGRIFHVKKVSGFNKKEMKEITHQIAKANITVRNFPLPVEEIRRKTGIKDGGDLYIFATTSVDGKIIIILCEKVS